MLHLPNLINDLGILLIIAALVTFIFKLIKQPVVLGYIVAGFLVGPNFKFVPSITDGETIKVWAEIGVIFLLFGLGLEFSFKKLKQVGGPASITGILEVIFMLAAGYFTGRMLGWNEMDSIFLGGILSISSTTIIIRAFDELGVKSQHFATVVFGVLIVEDLVAILLLVLLSTIAVTQQFQGNQLAFSSLKLVFFLTLWFVSGIFLIPTVLKKFKKHLNDELLLIFSLGLCLVMVIAATQVGFSPALGAFVMGSILAESAEGKRIEHLIQPLKDFFGAIFFVSVGMLIDPALLLEHWESALLISVVTIIGKIISSSAGSLISGQTLKNSVQTGFSLAQIGEFSFIIATLGLSLKVTSDFLYPLAVAVSVITTFTTPYLIKYSGGFAESLEKRLPLKWKDAFHKYSSSTQAVSVSSDAREEVKKYIVKLLLLTFVLVAITFLSKSIFLNVLKSHFSERASASLTFFSAFLLSTPFYWALTRSKLTPRIFAFNSPRLVFVPFVLHVFRYVIALSILSYQVISFLPTFIAFLVIGALSALGFIWSSNRLEDVYTWFERTFLTNLNSTPITEAPVAILLPWDAHLAVFEVSADADYIGKSLEQLSIREKYGVSIVLVERGSRRFKAPSKDLVIYPHDKLSVIGTDDQLDSFKAFIETKETINADAAISNYGLKGCILREDSVFIGKTIRESGIREGTEGIVVGLERRSERIINPDSKIQLEKDDLLWIVGNKVLLKALF